MHHRLEGLLICPQMALCLRRLLPIGRCRVVHDTRLSRHFMSDSSISRFTRLLLNLQAWRIHEDYRFSRKMSRFSITYQRLFHNGIRQLSGTKLDYTEDCTFCVGNNPIKYVDSYEHLGHVVTNQLTDNADIRKRKSDFVGKSNNALCFFSKLSSMIKHRLYFTHIAWACMAVSSGCLVTTRSTTCVFHGGIACAEYGACHSILTVICSRSWVSVAFTTWDF